MGEVTYSPYPFLEADIVFRKEGEAYRVTKTRFGERGYQHGLTKEDCDQLVRELEKQYDYKLKVTYG